MQCKHYLKLPNLAGSKYIDSYIFEENKRHGLIKVSEDNSSSLLHQTTQPMSQKNRPLNLESSLSLHPIGHDA
jgi:hypothetical protein